MLSIGIADNNRQTYAYLRENPLMSIGSRIKSTRKELGLTQIQLAKMVKIKQPSLSELEKGETKAPKGATLIAIANALKVNPTWLMTGSGKKMAEEAIDLTSDILELAERIAELPDDKRDLLMKIFSKDGVSDNEVESKMPITKTIKTDDYEGEDRRKAEASYSGPNKRGPTVVESEGNANNKKRNRSLKGVDE